MLMYYVNALSESRVPEASSPSEPSKCSSVPSVKPCFVVLENIIPLKSSKPAILGKAIPGAEQAIDAFVAAKLASLKPQSGNPKSAAAVRKNKKKQKVKTQVKVRLHYRAKWRV
jgi:hypothetical protein